MGYEIALPGRDDASRWSCEYLGMWISSDGRTHTAAWAEPLSALPDPFLVFLEGLDPADREVLSERLGESLGSTSEQIEAHLVPESDSDVEASFERLWVKPVEFESFSKAETLDDVIALVSAVDIRWRLDVILVLEDALTELSEPTSSRFSKHQILLLLCTIAAAATILICAPLVVKNGARRELDR